MSADQTTAADAYRAGQSDMLGRVLRCVTVRGWQLHTGSDLLKVLSVLRIMDLNERPGGSK